MPPAALLIAAGGISAGAQVMQGIAAKNASDAQAAALTKQAGLERVQAANEIAASSARANELMATARTSAAAGGINPSSGSPKVVNQTNAAKEMINESYMRYSGELRRQNALYEAAVARNQGNQALAGGILGGLGSTALTGFMAAKPGAII